MLQSNDPQDFEMGIEIYKNMKVKHKELLSLLIAKILVFKKRRDFQAAISARYHVDQLIKEHINLHIEELCPVNAIYKKIFEKI
tara:strand:+ start:673 stop:924 length:252 start_codon:yes stop_codon:yes gene_type:complete